MKTPLIHIFLLMGFLVCFGRPVYGQDTAKSSRQFKMGLAPLPILPPDSVKIDGEWIYSVYDKPPTPPGGQDGYMEYLKNNFKFHEICTDHGVQGKVYVSMVVDKKGFLSDIHILKDEVGYEYGEEAVRVFKSMPPWTPGIRNGKAVNVRYVIPVKTTLH